MDNKVTNSDLYTIFRKRFQKLRRNRGYKSIQSFADAYDEKFRKDDNSDKVRSIISSVKKWELGKSLPSLDSLNNICKLLDCDPLYLMGELPENCTSKESADFKEYTGLSEETYKNLLSLKRKHTLQKKYGYITELEVLESIINQKQNNLLNSIWGRVSRTYPKQELEVHTPGNGWKINPNELRASDNMLLYNSILAWIENYDSILEIIENGEVLYTEERGHKCTSQKTK